MLWRFRGFFETTQIARATMTGRGHNSKSVRRSKLAGQALAGCTVGTVAWCAPGALPSFSSPAVPRRHATSINAPPLAANLALSTLSVQETLRQASPQASHGAMSFGAAALAAGLLALGAQRQLNDKRVPCSRSGASATQLRGLRTGMVGLPNVGKSTLFNALCENGKADAQNFPFCTIEPNVARATVPDPRLHTLADLSKSQKTIPEQIEYVDIAGLVKGASKGEGLGNKFLSNIREVDAIVHVVRCFEDDDITHVDGSINPARDIETINLELMLADLDQCENRLKKLEKDVKNKVKGADVEQNAVLKVKKTLEEFKPARVAELNEKEEEALKSLPMLTKKRVIYAANVSEDDLAEGNNHVESVRQVAAETGDEAVIVSAQVEAELCGLDAQERAEFLETLGVEESGCNNLIRETYQTLGLRTYYTTGPQESRAWTIRAGWKAPQAAGVIHTDFEEGFIKAATVSYDVMLECGSEEEAASKGKLRIEGKDYVVQDGDVMHFRFK